MGTRFYPCGTLLFCMTILACPALGDTVHLSDGRSVHGRVLTFDRDTVLFAEQCGAQETKLSWKTLARLEFGHLCDGPLEGPAQLFENRCEGENFRVFVVEFRHGGLPVIAESAVITRDSVIQFDMLNPWDQAHGSVQEVRQVAKGTVCREDINRAVRLPATFCSEPRQVAVAFDYKTPLSNRILTNGFSFFIRVSGSRPEAFDLDAFRKEVRSAFQHAISLWTFALQERKHLLTDEIAKFIEARSSKSPNGFTLLTPPQVIELSCPHAATFVVDLSFGNRALFPRPPLVLAKAQTEGRTVAVNVLDIKCFRSEFKFGENKQLAFELSDRCLNLVPIMTHELGHAFGIAHIDDDTAHAVMDSRFSRDALVPTDRDVVEFVRVLSKSISGSAPGMIEMVSSNGVQPPIDYVECPDGAAGSGPSGCN